jgi:hypothetical protein
MSVTEVILNDIAMTIDEIDFNDYDLNDSPFFKDLEPNSPVNSMGFDISRPHRPPRSPEATRELLDYLKQSIDKLTSI